jgi:tRNA (guanosine-2'-O-)-methyltransferase
VKPLGPTDLKRLHRSWRRRTEGRIAVLLDGVQNPFNLGSIARTAAVQRVERGWIVGDDVSMQHPKARKLSMGTDRLVPWEHVPTTAAGIAAARAGGFAVIGVELTGDARPIFEVDLRRPTCLVVGHEERGLSAVALSSCDAVVYLPQVGKVGSLNVATTLAIALYEVRRQEWGTDAGGAPPN